MRLHVLTVMLMLALSAGAASATPAIDDEAKAAIQEAVGELQERYIKARTAGELGPERANFFKTSGKKYDRHLTPEIVVLALNERIHTEPSVDAYIKWELVASLDTIPDELVPSAVQAYYNAPLPEPQPGMEMQDQMRLQQALQGARQNQLPRIRSQWQQELKTRTSGNHVIFGYRNALRERLPVGPQSIQAALQDAYQRAEAGHNPKPVVDKIISNARSWAIDAPPAQVRAVAEMMADAAGHKGPRVFTGLEWDDGARAIKFVPHRFQLDEELRIVAEEIVAMNQGGGLQLK
ncbi:MAG: hypothetical protein AAGD32_10375 [Planctomycetota bacterium]